MRFFALCCAAAALLIGCGDADHFANPYDARNPLTEGGVVGVEIINGDESAVVMWRGLGLSGTSSYRIYRRYMGDPNSTYELIGEKQAELDPSTGIEVKNALYRFEDPQDSLNPTALLNDSMDPATGNRVPYLYRVSAVDDEGTESPDPSALDERPWLGYSATPSAPPAGPIPVPLTSDLRVELEWTEYALPDDVQAYRVYVSNDGIEWTLAQEIDARQTVGNDTGQILREEDLKRYVDDQFTQDGQVRHYRTGAVDDAGVESAAEPSNQVEVATPNLPPAGVLFVFEALPLPGGLQRIHIVWAPAPEADVVGYNVYERAPLDPTGWTLRETLEDPAASETWLTPDEGASIDYFVTAYDDTPRDDGSFDQIYPPGFVNP